MKYIDVFDSKGDWLDTEVFADDYPESQILTYLRSKSIYPPNIWVQNSEITAGGAFPARIEYTPSLKEGLCCSFCGKHKDEVATLVASSVQADKAICGDCIKTLYGGKNA